MIAWGDYYMKLEWIETTEWQLDVFTPNRTGMEINFDDTKKGEYSIIVDDFQNNGTGSIYLSSLRVQSELQKYTFDWDKVTTSDFMSIKHEVDIDNDDVYDRESYFLPMPNPQNNRGNISGYVIWNTNAKMAGWKVYLDINKNGILEENQEPFVITDNTGYYEFIDIEAWEYIVKYIPHNGWDMVTPMEWEYFIYLNNGQAFWNLNFTTGKQKWWKKK